MVDQIILTPVYAANRTNKPIGKIVKRLIDGKETVVLEKTLRTRHMLRQPPAICYDLEIVELAKQYGVEILYANNLDTKINYQIRFEKFLEKSFRVNRGYGPQLGAVLREWDTNYKPRIKFEYSASRDAQTVTIEPTDYQQSLFD